MDNISQTNANSMLVWLALALSIISLILAWTAYNRAGVDLEEQVEREVREALVELDVELEEVEQAARDNTADVLREGAQELNEGAADVRTDEE